MHAGLGVRFGIGRREGDYGTRQTSGRRQDRTRRASGSCRSAHPLNAAFDLVAATLQTPDPILKRTDLGEFADPDHGRSRGRGQQ